MGFHDGSKNYSAGEFFGVTSGPKKSPRLIPLQITEIITVRKTNMDV